MLEQMGIAAKQASYKLAQLSSREKNRVLEKIADELEAQSEIILNANAQDVADARANGLGEAMLDRLALTPARLKGIADDVRQVCNLADPVGQVIDGSVLDSGLRLERRRVPLGVIGVIYEARPNVTVDVASLCLKTGNAVILRGGKETCRTNAATVAVIQDALKSCGLPAGAVQAIDNPDRALVSEMLRMDKYIDMLIPRGGAGQPDRPQVPPYLCHRPPRKRDSGQFQEPQLLRQGSGGSSGRGGQKNFVRQHRAVAFWDCAVQLYIQAIYFTIGGHTNGVLLPGTQPHLQRVSSDSRLHLGRLRSRPCQPENAPRQVPQGRGGTGNFPECAADVRRHAVRLQRHPCHRAGKGGRHQLHLRLSVHRESGRHGGTGEGL